MTRSRLIGSLGILAVFVLGYVLLVQREVRLVRLTVPAKPDVQEMPGGVPTEKLHAAESAPPSLACIQSSSSVGATGDPSLDDSNPNLRDEHEAIYGWVTDPASDSSSLVDTWLPTEEAFFAHVELAVENVRTALDADPSLLPFSSGELPTPHDITALWERGGPPLQEQFSRALASWLVCFQAREAQDELRARGFDESSPDMADLEALALRYAGEGKAAWRAIFDGPALYPHWRAVIDLALRLEYED